jgi:hypothetical protein
MLMQSVKAESDWTSYLAAGLLRRWAALRRSGEAALPGLVATAAGLGTTPIIAVAFGSVFQLTEACLGRPLDMEGCCTPEPRPDAHAVLHMLDAQQGAGMALDLRGATPGLFGALVSAIASVRRLLSEQEGSFTIPAVDRIGSYAVCAGLAPQEQEAST